MRTDLTAYLALEKVANDPAISTVLDVGSGAGLHAEYMREHGKSVFTNSLIPPADIVGDFMQIPSTPGNKVSCIWAAHVLEHQPNVNAFLRKCFDLLKDDGVLAITVPPLKTNLVGGHLTLWTPALLVYNVILAGFDCRFASVRQYGYNISLIVRKKAINLPPLLMDKGDIETLAEFFPFKASQNCEGNFEKVNWDD